MQLQLQPENFEDVVFKHYFDFRAEQKLSFEVTNLLLQTILTFLFTCSPIQAHMGTQCFSLFFVFVFKVNKQQRVHSQLDNKTKWEQGTLNLTYCLDQIMTCHYFLPGSLLTSPKVTQNTHKLKYFKVCASFCTGATLSQNCLSSYHICPGSHRDTCTCWSLKDIVEGNRKWGMIIYDAQKE